MMQISPMILMSLIIKVPADSADHPDDADKPDDLDESDNSDDPSDSLITSWASCLSCKKYAWPRFPRPGQWPKSGQFLLTAFCKMVIFRPLAARSPQRPGEIRFRLIVLMIRIMQISPMILMNLRILIGPMILSCLLGTLVQVVKSSLGPDFCSPGSARGVANSY